MFGLIGLGQNGGQHAEISFETFTEIRITCTFSNFCISNSSKRTHLKEALHVLKYVHAAITEVILLRDLTMVQEKSKVSK